MKVAAEFVWRRAIPVITCAILMAWAVVACAHATGFKQIP